jgi:hypothetical protein
MRATKKEINVVELYTICLKNRWIREDCFVNNPVDIMGLLLGGAWACEKVEGGYKPKDGEIVIYRYEARVGRSTLAHFVLGGKDGSVEWDPYGKSNTVANGRLISSRVFRRA